MRLANKSNLVAILKTVHLAALGFTLLVAPVRAQTNAMSVGEDAPGKLDLDSSIRLPAVSQVNGKISYAGGNMNSAVGNNFDGSLSLPLTHKSGFQADALYSRISGFNFYGAAGHLFLRDPDLGLIGVTGGYLARQSVNTFQVGAEAEYYLGRFTFGGFAGLGSISYASVTPFISTTPTRFVGRISADYYPLDDLRLGVSGTTAFNNYLVQGEAEWQTPIRNLALTAEVATGANGFDQWLLGVRYYFGGKKTLRARHRQDDPRSLMPQILSGLGLYGAKYNRSGSDYYAANPEAGTWSGDNGYGFNLFGAERMRMIYDGDPPVVIMPPMPPLDEPPNVVFPGMIGNIVVPQ